MHRRGGVHHAYGGAVSYGKRTLPQQALQALAYAPSHRSVVALYENQILNPDGRCRYCHAPFREPSYCLVCAPLKAAANDHPKGT